MVLYIELDTFHLSNNNQLTDIDVSMSLMVSCNVLRGGAGFVAVELMDVTGTNGGIVAGTGLFPPPLMMTVTVINLQEINLQTPKRKHIFLHNLTALISYAMPKPIKFQ